MAIGGNSKDRRKMRRLVQSILETYGYSSQKIADTAKSRKTAWDFFIKYILPAVAVAGFGHWVSEVNPVVSGVAHILALLILFRGLWEFCTARWQTIVLIMFTFVALAAMVWRDYVWIKKEWTPTFIYLVPTREIVNCERRAFFVNHAGYKSIQNVKIVVKDNKSGEVQENDDFRSGIEPGPQDPDAPRYIWIKPSHPWDEDYTITVTGTKFRLVQQIALRTANKKAQLGVEIRIGEETKPLIKCRDDLLPVNYSLARDARENCNTLMSIDPQSLNKLKPEIYGFQNAGGDYSAVKIRKLPTASDLDSQSEDRHLTEYQQTVMRATLAKYAGQKLLILYAGGSKSLAYANEFKSFFHSQGWRVQGPRLVPVGDEELVDMQVSVSKAYWNTPNPVAQDLMGALEGTKHRQRYVYDDAVPADLIVLWVGPKSPSNFSPDDCAPAALHPNIAEPNTCETVAQTNTVCPFPPN